VGGNRGERQRQHYSTLAAKQWSVRNNGGVNAVTIARRQTHNASAVKRRSGIGSQQTKTTVDRLQHQDSSPGSSGSSTWRNGSELYIVVRLDAMSRVRFSLHLNRQHSRRIFPFPPIRLRHVDIRRTIERLSIHKLRPTEVPDTSRLWQH